MTNASVVENEIHVLGSVTKGIQQELAALHEFLELAYNWTDVDRLDLALAMARKATEMIQEGAQQAVSSVETLKEHAGLPPEEPADLGEGAGAS